MNTSSNASVLDYAEDLKSEADTLLYERGIDAILKAYGDVYYTGSYFLDLMAWRDIDVYLVLEPSPSALERFWEVGKQIAQLDGVHRCNFLNTHRHPRESLPSGFYWGVRLDMEDGSTWKIDIWAPDAAFVERNRISMERVASALTDDTRRLILEAKHALMLPEGRTPILSGIHIYEAVLFKRLCDIEAIRNYLREKEIAGV